MNRISVVKVIILSKAVYRFIIIHIKMPMVFLKELEKGNPKIFMEVLMTQNSYSNLIQKEQQWKHHTIQFQNTQQSFNSKNHIIGIKMK